MKGALSPAMRVCLYRMKEYGGVLERRRQAIWTFPDQPDPPVQKFTFATVDALIERGELVVVESRRQMGSPRPYPTKCALPEVARAH